MRNFVTLSMTLLVMTLMSSGVASAVESPLLPEKTTARVDAKVQVDPSPLVRRNAAAKALKTKIDKQNAERNSNAQQQKVQQEVLR